MLGIYTENTGFCRVRESYTRHNAHVSKIEMPLCENKLSEYRCHQVSMNNFCIYIHAGRWFRLYTTRSTNTPKESIPASVNFSLPLAEHHVGARVG